MGFHITDWTSEKEDPANQDGEGFPGPLVQGLNGHALLFYFVAPLSPTSRQQFKILTLNRHSHLFPEKIKKNQVGADNQPLGEEKHKYQKLL